MQRRNLTRRRALRREASDTERTLWRAVRARGLGAKLRRQHALGPYVVDFYCAGRRLVIEIDGDSHATEEAIAHDARRTSWLEARGLRVLRFTNRDVRERLDAVLEAIAAAVGPSP